MWKIIIAFTLISGAVAQNGDNFPCRENATDFLFWYNTTDCTGEPLFYVCEYHLNSKRVENKPSRAEELLSTRVLGTNRFTFVTEWNQSYFSYVIGFEPNGTECLKLSDLIPLASWNEYRLNQTHGFGSERSPSQIFFTERDNYQGNFHWVSLDQKGNFSPYPITARSYIHVSNDTWVIYKGKEYTGETTCLCPTNTTTKATEVRKTNVELVVGSVKIDKEGICDCNSGGFGSRQIPNFFNFVIIIALVGLLSL